jgi:small subunit ribosomal protein S16
MPFKFAYRFSLNSTNLPQYSEMIKIRLQRHGARHAPFYRMVVTPSQSRRDGKFIEVLGTYNPQAHKREEELKLKIERIDHWLGVGAQPTDTAKSLIRQGRMSPEEWLNRAEKLSDSKLKRKSKGDTAPSMDEGSEAAKEEKPAEEAPVAEEPKAEEKPAVEEKPAEEATKAEEKKEEAPVAEKPKAEEKPEAQAEDKPVAEQKPVEDSKKADPQAEEKPEAEAKKDKAPAEDQKEEKPTEKKVAKKKVKTEEKAEDANPDDSTEEEKKDS